MSGRLKVLFYHPASGCDGFPEPPLGLGYLMGVAADRGAEAAFHDEEHHAPSRPLERLLEGFAPDLIAVSFMTPQFPAAAAAVRTLKARFPKAVVIAGGAHPSCLPERTLRDIPGVDYVCKGEGEKTFAEFLDALAGLRKVSEVPGLYRREGGAVRANPPRELAAEAELDSFRVDWDALLKDGPYVCKVSYLDELGPVYPVITARGCPFRCTFCAEGAVWEHKVRFRPLPGVVEEIRGLKARGALRFNILDDTFTLRKPRVLEFCDAVEPLGIKFRITARATSVDPEMLRRLKATGCELAAYGVESGDDEVLKAMRKQQTVKDVEAAFRMTREAGILAYALCMVGNLGEDRAAVERTAALLGRLEPDLAGCSIMTPYPGTENYETCRKNGWLHHEDWEDWVPSLLKASRPRPVSRTDKLDEDGMLDAYYALNRAVLAGRFRRKYGALFPLSPAFWLRELWPRLRSVGGRAFAAHLWRFRPGR